MTMSLEFRDIPIPKVISPINRIKIEQVQILLNILSE
jgi:hypothetical protein